MESSYLTGLPRQSIRLINGFPGAGWFPRASIPPPESLLRKVFPEVDEILPLVESGYDDDNDISSTSGYPRTIFGQAFLNLSKKMRNILIQDAVFVRVDYPHNPSLGIHSSKNLISYNMSLPYWRYVALKNHLKRRG
jgi:hypothetical protein